MMVGCDMNLKNRILVRYSMMDIVPNNYYVDIICDKYGHLQRHKFLHHEKKHLVMNKLLDLVLLMVLHCRVMVDLDMDQVVVIFCHRFSYMCFHEISNENTIRNICKFMLCGLMVMGME